MTTLVAGCGYVGGRVAERLASRGEGVLGLVRTARALPAGVEPVIATLPDDALALPSSIDRLVYAVAPGGRTDEAYAIGYPRGLASVLDALDRAGATLRRVVLVSSTAVYAQDDGSVVDERSDVTNEGTAARILEAERLLASRLGERGVVLRLSGIYGPGRERMVRAIAEGRVLPGDPTRIANRIHRDDAAAAVVHLLALAAPAPIYVGTDEGSGPLGALFAFVADALGVALPPADPAADRGPGRATSKRLDASLLRASGFRFAYPTYREGYRAAIDAVLAERAALRR